MTKNTKNPKRLSAIISGVFMVALLAAVVGVTGIINTSTVTTSTSAQTLVEQNESASFTMFGVTPSPDPRSVNISSNGPEFITDQNFTLTWTSQGVANIQATGDWSGGGLPANGSDTISESSAGTYTYGIRGIGGGPGGPITDEVTVTVVEPPRFDFSFPAGSAVDLDGEPGSITGIDLMLTSEEEYEGDVEIIIDPDDVDPDMSADGGYLIDFFGYPSTVTLTDGASSTITISMETLQSILTDTTYEVEVLMRDLSGTAVPEEKTGTFEINADGFAPRTIEEF